MTGERPDVPEWLVESEPAAPRGLSRRRLVVILATLAAVAAVVWTVVLLTSETPRTQVCSAVPDGPPGLETLVVLLDGSDC